MLSIITGQHRDATSENNQPYPIAWTMLSKTKRPPYGGPSKATDAIFNPSTKRAARNSVTARPCSQPADARQPIGDALLTHRLVNGPELKPRSTELLDRLIEFWMCPIDAGRK
jgi:hypothetical protein